MRDMTAKIFMTIFGVMGWGFVALQFWFAEDIELWRRIAATLFSGVVIFGLFWCAKTMFGERW